MSGDCAGRNTLAATWLGDVELSPHAILRGLYDQPRLTWEDKRTIGGRLVYRPAVAIRGRALTLDLLEGHATVGQLLAVQALVDAGEPVTLRHHAWTGAVRVDAIESAGLPIDYADYKADDWASAEIRLTEL